MALGIRSARDTVFIPSKPATRHGVIDAGLAVEMAKQWTTLGQNIAPNTEKTFTTSIVDYGTGGLNLPAAEKMAER